MASEVPKEAVLKARTELWYDSLGCTKSLSLMVAVQLGIPDAVHSHGGPVSVPDLASAVGVPEAKVPVLRRLMRALSYFGVFDRDTAAGGAEEVYIPTVLSRQLCADDPTTAAPFLLLGLHPLHVTTWYSMAAWFRGDGTDAASGFESARGETAWESVGRLPELGDLLTRAMACDSRWAVGFVAREHPEVFRGITSLVDVGGGNGASAKAVKDAFPEVRCTVLELPHVVAAAPALEGVEFVGGSMFEHIPPANAILLKWVFNEWNDDDSVKILQRCKEAIPARELGGKVIILDIVLGSDDGGGGGGGSREIVAAQHLFDLHMMMVTGGRERREEEWRHIFEAAGFGDCKITPVLETRSVIEVYP